LRESDVSGVFGDFYSQKLQMLVNTSQEVCHKKRSMVSVFLGIFTPKSEPSWWKAQDPNNQQ